MKLTKGYLETLIILILSPIMSIPLLILQTIRKDKNVLKLISLLFGFLGFLYIPTSTNDKARYFERYIYFDDLSLEKFLDHLVLTKRPDFVFESMLFIFSKMNIDIQWLFLLITTFIVYSILSFCNNILENNYKQSKLLSLTPLMVLIIILSFSYSGLFSGVRYYFALSIFLWSIYYLFINKHLVKGVILITLSILTHFSFSLFVPAIIIFLIFKSRINYKYIFICSLVFLILPQNFLENILGFLELPETYGNKADVYLNSEVEFSQNSIILNFLRNAWIYFLFFFILFINKDKDNDLINLLIFFTSVVNITYAIPLVYNRYIILLKIMFLVVIFISSIKDNTSKKYLYILLTLFFISFLIDINVLRYNIIASYSIDNLWNLILLFNSKITPNDFL